MARVIAPPTPLELLRPHPRISTSQKSTKKSTRDHPAAASTNELVHIFLFSGNQLAQKYPRFKHTAAPAARPSALVLCGNDERTQRPASRPSSVVPSAGRSLSNPSGSRASWFGGSSYNCPGI